VWVREREKNERETRQTSIDKGKVIGDISADERFYNRSVKIRRKVMEWMIENVNGRWESLGEMEARAANFAGCSMPCSRRWLFQFSQPGKPFRIVETTDWYILRERPEYAKS
jgi:hypothetical protein